MKIFFSIIFFLIFIFLSSHIFSAETSPQDSCLIVNNDLCHLMKESVEELENIVGKKLEWPIFCGVHQRGIDCDRLYEDYKVKNRLDCEIDDDFKKKVLIEIIAKHRQAINSFLRFLSNNKIF